MDLTKVIRWEKEVWELARPVSNDFMNTLICVWKSTGVFSEIQMACVSNKAHNGTVISKCLTAKVKNNFVIFVNYKCFT